MLIRAGALVACLTGAFLLRLPWFGLPTDRDAGQYMAVGRNLGWDTLPYRDLFDHKQPLIYPFYWAIETAWPQDMDALRVTSALLAGLGAYLVFLVLARLAGPWRGALAAAITLVGGASLYVEGGDLNVEHLALPFAIAAVLVPLALKDRPGDWVPLLAGLLAAVPALMKISLLPGLVAGLVPLLLTRPRPARTAALYAAGLGAPFAVVLLFFAARGALGDLVEANVTFNRNYAELTDDRWDRFWRHGEVLWLAAGGLAVGVARLVAARGRDVVALTLTAWLLGAAVGAASPGVGFPHYFVQVIPPAACLLALAPLPGLRPRVAAVATALLVAVLVWPFAKQDVQALGYDEGEVTKRLYGQVQFDLWSTYDDVGEVIAARAGPGDRMYVVESEPGFYWRAGVPPASRVMFESGFRALPELQAEVTRGLCRFPPRFVVLPFEGWPAHLACLRDNPDLGYEEIFRRGTVVVMARPPGVLDLEG